MKFQGSSIVGRSLTLDDVGNYSVEIMGALKNGMVWDWEFIEYVSLLISEPVGEKSW